MRKLRSNTSSYIFHGLAVIAVLLFVAPLEAAHSDTQTEPVAEWSGEHSSADGHDHGDSNEHSSLDILQGHCDPGPDCSNSYAVLNVFGMAVGAPVFHLLIGSVVNLSSGRITLRDIPPPKRIS